MKTILCKICKEEFVVRNYRAKKALYCSVTCYRQDPEWREKVSRIKKGKTTSPNTCFQKGHPVPDDWRKKIALTKFGKPAWNKGTKGVMKAWNKGKKTNVKHSKQFRKGQSPWNKGIGTKCAETRLIRSSLQYRMWRNAVYERDKFTCQLCGKVGGKLNADHIKKFAEYPSDRFNIDNGRTLCEGCHRNTPNFGRKNHKC